MKYLRHWYVTGLLTVGLAVGLTYFLTANQPNKPTLLPAKIPIANFISYSADPAIEQGKTDLSQKTVINAETDAPIAERQRLMFSKIGSGFRSLQNLEETYWERIEAARDGDGEAMRIVSRVLNNCKDAFSIRTSQNAVDLFDEGALSLEEYEAIRNQIGDCAAIVKDQAEDIIELSKRGYNGEPHMQWLRLAWEAGDKQARLEYLLDTPGEAQELARLLDELVNDRDPVVLYIASTFFDLRSPPETPQIGAGWRLLACMNLESCDERLYEEGLRRHLYEAQADQAVNFAHNFKSLSQSGISFTKFQRMHPYTSRSPEQIETHLNLVRKTGSEDLIGIDRVLNMSRKSKGS